MSDLYIGLMSGTSMDGIDAALVDLTTKPKIISTLHRVYPDKLLKRLNVLCKGMPNELKEFSQLDSELGKMFAQTANDLIKQAKLTPGQISAIGSHGQTIRHYPKGEHRNSLQIADPNVIAESCNVTTVADFRRRDIAAGGEGAPLVPAFHHAVFHSLNKNRVILNIGGIANITILPADNENPTLGFDTGPGNTLMDNWHAKHKGASYDKNGDWAKQGAIDNTLLKRALSDPYFSSPPPKSTGREHFNLAWLEGLISALQANPLAVDIQTTLCEITAISIAQSIQHHAASTDEILICGGGIHNRHLMQRLKTHLEKCTIQSTETYGIHPDWLEAVAFAWLAKQTLDRKPGNLPSVTGASRATILGGIYTA